jgi:hypothetical protein
LFFFHIAELMLAFALYLVNVEGFRDFGSYLLGLLVDLGFEFLSNPLFAECTPSLFTGILETLQLFQTVCITEFWNLLGGTAASLGDDQDEFDPNCYEPRIAPFILPFLDVVFDRIDENVDDVTAPGITQTLADLTRFPYPEVHERLRARLNPASPASWFVIACAGRETQKVFALILAPEIDTAPWAAIHFVASCAQFVPDSAPSLFGFVLRYLDAGGPSSIAGQAVDSLARLAPGLFDTATFERLGATIENPEIDDSAILGPFLHALLLICNFWDASGVPSEGLSAVMGQIGSLYVSCFQRIGFSEISVFVRESIVSCQGDVPRFAEFCQFCCCQILEGFGELWTSDDAEVQIVLAEAVAAWLEHGWLTAHTFIANWLSEILLRAPVLQHFDVVISLTAAFPIPGFFEVFQHISEMPHACRYKAVQAIAEIVKKRPELSDELPLQSILAPFATVGDFPVPSLEILRAFFSRPRSPDDVHPVLSMLVRKFRTWGSSWYIYTFVVCLARKYGMLELVCNELCQVVSETAGGSLEGAQMVVELMMSENPFGPNMLRVLDALRGGTS